MYTRFFKAVLVCSSLFIASFLTSCLDDTPQVPQAPRGRYTNGVFIINEGGSAGTGDISFWDLDSNKVTNSIFARENNPVKLGVYAQSMLLHGNKGYIAVDNANKIIVVNQETFQQEGVLSFQTPHTMLAEGNTGYVTEWINNDYANPPKGRLAFVDLSTQKVTDTVNVDGAFPTKMVLLNNRLYITNSLDSTISIVNTQTRKLENKVVVGYTPNSIVVDKDNMLWVLVGNYTKATSKLIQLKPNNATLTVQKSFTIDKSNASRLTITPSKDKLYYLANDNVYVQDIAAATVNTTPFLQRGFYGIGIDPTGTIFYGTDAGNYRDNGKVIRYNISTKAKIDSATVGVIPNGVVF